MKNRVFITGAGIVSPIGSSLEAFNTGLRNGIHGTAAIKGFNTDLFPVSVGAEVNYSALTPDADRKKAFISGAMKELLSDSRFLKRYSPDKLILNMGTGIDFFDLVSYVDSPDSETGHWENYCKRSYDIVKELAAVYNIKGGYTVNVSACVASNQSIGLSFRMLRENGSPLIITGGFDSMLCPLHYMGFYKLGALSDWKGDPAYACKPFDKKRCGMVIGEGGIAFALESEQNANPADILCEIAGYSTTMDAFTVTDPNPEGTFLAKAGLNAIRDAGLTPNDIDAVHLHETGTIKNALAEAKAMMLIFGDRYTDIPVYSLKGQIGHLIGACGAMEIAGAIYSLKNQTILPTVNFDEADPEVGLRVIKGEPLKMKLKNILKLSAAFGGQNAAFVLKKYE